MASSLTSNRMASTLHRYSLFFGLLILALLGTSTTAFAHERWFVPQPNTYQAQFQLLFTWPVLLTILLASLTIPILALFRLLVKGNNRFPEIGFLRYYDRSHRPILAVQTAITLIFAACNLVIFAPNLHLPPSPIAYLIAAAEILVAFTFISGVLTRPGAALLIVLFLTAFFFFPFWIVLEQTMYVGIALYLLIMGRGLTRPLPLNTPAPLSNMARYWHLAPFLLRLGAGTTIIVLAFTEKLLNPALAEAFLRDYPHFNFMQLLGFDWFTNERFILAAGTVELAVGLALISGILPKIVIFGMFVPFNLTLPFLPPVELLGHLPIFATMYVLLFLPPEEELKTMAYEDAAANEQRANPTPSTPPAQQYTP